MDAPRKRRLMGEINVVPYIDVMLVLLIIFMVTAPMLTQGIEVDLPKAATEPLDSEMQETEPLILSIDAEGQLYLSVGDNEDAPKEPAEIVRLSQTVLKRKPETPVLVKADKSVSHGNVVRGMALLQQAGAGKVGIVADPALLEPIEVEPEAG